jgi:uncharacterized protein YceK
MVPACVTNCKVSRHSNKTCETVILVLPGRAELLFSRPFQGEWKMAFRAICVALLLSSLPLAGCGTVANLVKPGPEWGGGGKSPFGGVHHDVGCIETAANGDSGFRTHPKWESEQYQQVARTLFWAADLPFSLIGDVLTWPYTASYSFINQPIPVPPVIQAPDSPPPQAAGLGRPQTPAASSDNLNVSNNLNAYVTILSQTQPLAAAACSSYFLTPGSLEETLPEPRKSP